MFLPRPSFTQPPSNILYDKVFTLATKIPASAKIITAVIIDLGYATHGVHMNQRSVELVVIRYGNNLAIRGPTSSGIYPPGYGWLHILADGVPAKGMRVMVGDGSSKSPSFAFK